MGKNYNLKTCRGTNIKWKKSKKEKCKEEIRNKNHIFEHDVRNRLLSVLKKLQGGGPGQKTETKTCTILKNRNCFKSSSHPDAPASEPDRAVYVV